MKRGQGRLSCSWRSQTRRVLLSGESSIQNLPSTLVAILSGFGHETDTAEDEGVNGKSDEIVWERAQLDGRFLITQDLDFSDIRKFTLGTHHGILLIRMRDPSRRALEERIGALFAMEESNSWNRGFIVATDLKIRATLAPV
jgi:predicted nuclease of predicted toxin-antitoxin system